MKHLISWPGLPMEKIRSAPADPPTEFRPDFTYRKEGRYRSFSPLSQRLLQM